jgi:NADPH-dependent curcumin reductase CurA
MSDNRQVLIDSLPDAKLAASNYKVVSAPMPVPGDGEVLCRTLMVTIAAGSRAGLQGSASYAGAPKTNIVMGGTGVARVEASNADGLNVGDLVVCPSGWQDYSVHAAKHCQKINDDLDIAHHLGALGTNGLTAYFGLLNISNPSAGNTVLISAAAGSVGHLVNQIAKIKGCRTVGTTSSEEKCHLLKDQLGYEEAVSYRSEDFRADLKAACPDGIDIYFDNTGGDVLGAALFRMNEQSTIVCCGVVSQYDTSNPSGGPRGVPGLLINKRIKMQGFLVFDYISEYANARAELTSWIRSGELKPVNDVVDGLENAPDAFVDLLAGGNVGTRMVRIAE